MSGTQQGQIAGYDACDAYIMRIACIAFICNRDHAYRIYLSLRATRV